MYLGHNMRPYMTYLPIKVVSPLTTRISVFFFPPVVACNVARPCAQGNWDTWMVLDLWNQV